MKRNAYRLFTLFTITLFMIACTSEVPDLKLTNADSPLSLDELSELVSAELNQGQIFHWKKSTSHVIWSAGMASDSIFSIGYKPAFFQNINSKMHEIDIDQFAWQNAKQLIEKKILEYERISRNEPELTMESLRPFGEVTYFPQIIIQLTSPELIEKLAKMSEVRYVEPLGFNLEDLSGQLRSTSGCNGSPNYNINTNDYQVINPNTKSAWNFYTHEIDAAWSESSGDDATICIIDTGASDDQDNLGSQFTSGLSGGRYIQKFSTHYSGMWWWKSLDSPHDQCGHGTSMCGQAAGPRGTDGNATGVAYKSNLVSVRAVEDVVITTSNERQGVRDALYLAANHTDVQIVSMSIGTPFNSGTISDAVHYAYNNGLAIFAAAGTSLSWLSWYGVIFPATMSETIAVTGVKDSNSNVKCETCHSGSEVDFVIVMERQSNSDRTSISLASSTNQPKYIGGSSSATATAAGIAGLVLAGNPGYDRSDLLQALKESSEYYPSRDAAFGWGRINALVAVNGGI